MVCALVSEGRVVLAFDVGTTSLKAALVSVSDFSVVSRESMPARIDYPRPGWAEQDVEGLWRDLAGLASNLLRGGSYSVVAVGFTAHMAGVVPVDEEGSPLRRAIIWLDERGVGYPRSLWRGIIKVYGYNLFDLIRFLRITGGAPGKTGKDPISKIHWLMDNEPDIFNSTYKFLDVKGYLIARATGNFVTSPDEASLTWLADTRGRSIRWHEGLLRKYRIPRSKLPEIMESTSIAGYMRGDSAVEMGLDPGIPVSVGAGDMTAAGVGSGAVGEGEAHVYIGTSDWIAAHHSKRLLDISHYIGSIMSAIPSYYFVVAEQEVAAGALEWFLDIAGLHGDYDFVSESLTSVPPGASGLLFTPWLYGERSPVDEHSLRGVLFNISLKTGKQDIIRAIIDGVTLNIKWAYSYFEKLVGEQEVINAIGGGTLFDQWCLSLASALKRPIRRMRDPQDAGLRGVAALAGVGVGEYSSVGDAVRRFRYDRVFEPDPRYARVYDELLDKFIKIYKNNRKLFRRLNLIRLGEQLANR